MVSLVGIHLSVHPAVFSRFCVFLRFLPLLPACIIRFSAFVTNVNRGDGAFTPFFCRFVSLRLFHGCVSAERRTVRLLCFVCVSTSGKTVHCGISRAF